MDSAQSASMNPPAPHKGALAGFRIVEFASKGPAPLCAMLLGDMGADVIRVERVGRGSEISESESGFTILNRNRRSLGLNLKTEAGREIASELIAQCDGVLEGFRPGVMERLGLGPDELLLRNRRLVYGRVTGWGREGPLAPRAGHDINYLALSGALAAIGSRGGPPVPPLNLLADYGGGGLYLAFGMVCALIEAMRSGAGQVVDVAMTDAVASLMTVIQGLTQAGHWREERGSNLLDSGAPFYTTYRTRDGRYMAVGPIEPEFHAEFVRRLGLPEQAPGTATDPASWADQQRHHQSIFEQRTQAEWRSVFDDCDACVSPVLALSEAPGHPHHIARGTYVEFGGRIQAAPTPRLSKTPGSLRKVAPAPGADTDEVLRELGKSNEQITALRESKAIF
jgi:alpha-methylacyl-CoA racemase